jgi:4a-hydroxytetrahydrobiopterin dehydratase
MSEEAAGAAEPLTDEQVDRALEMQPGWRRDGDVLRRELKFPDFETALRFVEATAEMASDYGRRPDMCISEFNHVRLAVANLHHAGLTRAEMRLATKVDAVIAEHGDEILAEGR